MKNKILMFILSSVTANLFGVSFDSSNPIVIPEKASPQENYAARQMANYLGKCSGKKFKIVPEGKTVFPGAIYIGATHRAEQAEMNQFKTEEYRIKVVGRDVIIAGSVERGILLGTYEFLERFAGVRFLTAECEVVPKMAKITVPDNTDVFHKPTFRYRYIYNGSRQFQDTTARKLRITGWASGPELGSSERFGFGNHCHTFYKYAANFPVEISWMSSGGKRVVNKSPMYGSICFRHPEVLKHFAARLKKEIANDRATAAKNGISIPRFYHISQNDCDAVCYCPECQNFAKQYGISGLVIDFVNRLYREIKPVYPDVYLVTFAYFDTLQPPKGGIQPDDHVLVQVATYTQKFHDHLRGISDPANKEYLKLLNEWEKCANGRLAIWDYWRYYSGFLPPATNALNLQEFCRKYRDLKVHLIFVEHENEPRTLVSFCDLSTFLGARLLDDPDKDAEKLIMDFMKGYYGSAAEYMRKYLTLIHEGMKKDAKPMEHEPFSTRKYLGDTEFYRQSFACLKKAREAVSGDAVRLARVNGEMLILESAYLKTWQVHSNVLKLNKAELQKDIESILPSVMKYYFSPKKLQKFKINELIDFYAEKIQVVPAKMEKVYKPLNDFDPMKEGVILLETSDIKGNGNHLNDADAPKGKTISISATKSKEEAEKMHKKTFVFGLYEKDSQKHLLSARILPANIPQDEKYHWYCIGTTRLYYGLNLWIHESWTLSWKVGQNFNSATPEKNYKIYVLLKFQGKGYVKDSKQQSDIRLARAALVPQKEE